MAPQNAPAGPSGTGQWDTVAAELRAYRDHQKETWGDLDSALLGRYLAGEANEQDRVRVEAALQEHPELRTLTDLVREVLDDCQPPAAPIQTEQIRPRILPFTKPNKPSPAGWKSSRARVALLFAASVMLALGIVLSSNSSQRGDSASPPLSTAFLASRSNQDRSAQDSNVVRTEQFRKGTEDDGKSHPSLVGIKSTDAQKKDSAPLLQPLQFVVAAKLSEPHGGIKFAGARDGVSNLEVHAVADLVDRLVAESRATESSSAYNPYNPNYATPGANPYTTPDAIDVTRTRGTKQTILANAVPVLEYGVRQQGEAKLQKRCAEVLARMGPAARPAVEPLADTLLKSDNEQQQQAIVQFFHQMGPSARQAAPKLEKFVASSRNEMRKQAQDAYRSVSEPAWVGVRDHARLLDDDARRRINARLSEFSQHHQFPVVAETLLIPKGQKAAVSAKAKQELLQEFARRRSNELGANNGMYVLICDEPPLVQVTLGDQVKLGKEAENAAANVRQRFERGWLMRNLEKDLDVSIKELQQAVEKDRK